jgi:AraC-like DNA-binding protein
MILLLASWVLFLVLIGVSDFISEYSFLFQSCWNAIVLACSMFILQKIQKVLLSAQFNWIWQFHLGFLVVFMAYVPVFISKEYFSDYFLSLKMPYTFLFLIFTLNNLRHLATNHKPLLFTNPLQSLMGNIDDQMSRIRKNTQSQQWFRDPGLNLPTLASRLNMSERQLSQIVNRVEGKNVSYFINELRLDYAISLMKASSEDMQIKEIMYESGFKSKASFNTAFRQKYHTTPSAFKNKLNNHLSFKSEIKL